MIEIADQGFQIKAIVAKPGDKSTAAPGTQSIHNHKIKGEDRQSTEESLDALDLKVVRHLMVLFLQIKTLNIELGAQVARKIRAVTTSIRNSISIRLALLRGKLGPQTVELAGIAIWTAREPDPEINTVVSSREGPHPAKEINPKVIEGICRIQAHPKALERTDQRSLPSKGLERRSLPSLT